MGRWIIIAGVCLVIVGLIVQFAPWMFNWFGRLPGDIRIEKEHTKVFIPITSMLVISLILTVLINLFKRF
jgi:hypothetical protein